MKTKTSLVSKIQTKKFIDLMLSKIDQSSLAIFKSLKLINDLFIAA